MATQVSNGRRLPLKCEYQYKNGRDFIPCYRRRPPQERRLIHSQENDFQALFIACLEGCVTPSQW